MGMNREFSLFCRYLILSILLLGTVSCGLKFGADARQAAESKGKNKPSPTFVEVDNTKPEPKVMPAKSPVPGDKKATEAAMAPATTTVSDPKTAEYVRMGKNRRLISNESDQTVENSAKKEQTQPTSPVEQVKGVHRKLRNTVLAAHEKVMTKLGRRKPAETKVLYPTVQLFGAGLSQSEWLVTSKDVECYITQPIPKLGKAKFAYNPVQQLKFIFEVFHPPARNLDAKDRRYVQALMTDKYPYPQVGAKLESIPPDWKPFAIKKMLGYIPFRKGFEPFVLPHRQRLVAEHQSTETKRNGQKIHIRQSELKVASLTTDYLPEIWPDRLMEELEEGMSIRLTYRDWIDGTQDIITSISPINFSKKKAEFDKCVSKLPKYDFNKFKQTQLNFTKSQRTLSKKMQVQLQNMVKFIKLDETIKKVMIKSYTDSMGFKRVNQGDAKIQAQAIKSYLKKLGMSVPITAIGIGEGPFVASNRSSAGRAQNRRSIITLIK